MKNSKKTAEPQALQDQELDQASGGVGMLLPAIQKVQAPLGTATPFEGGVRVAVGDVNADGSV